MDDGSGFPVLSIHGTGGGFDQGAALAAALREAGYRVIAPSRFGYLGAPVPQRSDAFAQADAFAELLDALAVERAVVTGASAGAITALAFAERYPRRTAALLLMVPAYYPPRQGAPEPWSPLRTWAVTTALGSDFLFWAGLKLAPTALATTVLATDRSLIDAADSRERARLDAVLAVILPISDRRDGLLLDGRNTASPPEIDLGAIRAPTFVASAEDDRYRTADSARLLALGIEGAELLITPDGGHVWVGRSDEIETAVAAFLDAAAPTTGSPDPGGDVGRRARVPLLASLPRATGHRSDAVRSPSTGPPPSDSSTRCSSFARDAGFGGPPEVAEEGPSSSVRCRSTPIADRGRKRRRRRSGCRRRVHRNVHAAWTGREGACKSA